MGYTDSLIFHSLFYSGLVTLPVAAGKGHDALLVFAAKYASPADVQWIYTNLDLTQWPDFDKPVNNKGQGLVEILTVQGKAFHPIVDFIKRKQVERAARCPSLPAAGNIRSLPTNPGRAKVPLPNHPLAPTHAQTHSAPASLPSSSSSSSSGSSSKDATAPLELPFSSMRTSSVEFERLTKTHSGGVEKRYALIIGVSHFMYASTERSFPPLSRVEKDVRLIKAQLRRDKCPFKTRTLLNYEATCPRASSNDLISVYFAGHGAKNVFQDASHGISQEVPCLVLYDFNSSKHGVVEKVKAATGPSVSKPSESTEASSSVSTVSSSNSAYTNQVKHVQADETLSQYHLSQKVPVDRATGELILSSSTRAAHAATGAEHNTDLQVDHVSLSSLPEYSTHRPAQSRQHSGYISMQQIEASLNDSLSMRLVVIVDACNVGETDSRAFTLPSAYAHNTQLRLQTSLPATALAPYAPRTKGHQRDPPPSDPHWDTSMGSPLVKAPPDPPLSLDSKEALQHAQSFAVPASVSSSSSSSSDPHEQLQQQQQSETEEGGGSTAPRPSLFFSGERFNDLVDELLAYENLMSCPASALSLGPCVLSEATGACRTAASFVVEGSAPALERSDRENCRFSPPGRFSSSPTSLPLDSVGVEKRYALIIGVSHFMYASTEKSFPPLSGVEKDVRLIQEQLRREKCPFETRTLLDCEATEKNVKKALEDLCQRASSEDLVLVYFAGHGAKSAFPDASTRTSKQVPCLLLYDFQSSTHGAVEKVKSAMGPSVSKPSEWTEASSSVSTVASSSAYKKLVKRAQADETLSQYHLTQKAPVDRATGELILSSSTRAAHAAAGAEHRTNLQVDHVHLSSLPEYSTHRPPQSRQHSGYISMHQIEASLNNSLSRRGLVIVDAVLVENTSDNARQCFSRASSSSRCSSLVLGPSRPAHAETGPLAPECWTTWLEALHEGNPQRVREIYEEYSYVRDNINDRQYNAVLLSAALGHVESLKVLWTFPEVDRHVRDDSQRTVLLKGAEYGRLPVIQWLFERPGKEVDLSARDSNSNNVLLVAAVHGRTDLVEWLWNREFVDLFSLNVKRHSVFDVAQSHPSLEALFTRLQEQATETPPPSDYASQRAVVSLVSQRCGDETPRGLSTGFVAAVNHCFEKGACATVRFLSQFVLFWMRHAPLECHPTCRWVRLDDLLDDPDDDDLPCDEDLPSTLCSDMDQIPAFVSEPCRDPVVHSHPLSSLLKPSQRFATK